MDYKLYINGKNQIVETRAHETWGYRADFGRASIQIKCPFCGSIKTGYVWSLAGGGKKCSCGALHATNQTYKTRTDLPGARVGEPYELKIMLWCSPGALGRIDGSELPPWLNLELYKSEENDRAFVVKLFGMPPAIPTERAAVFFDITQGKEGREATYKPRVFITVYDKTVKELEKLGWIIQKD